MKILITILTTFLLFITNLIFAQQSSITVTVQNMNSDAGKVGFALYQKDNFMGIPVQAKEGKITNGKTEVIFENVPSGVYAITCYHDKNNNGQLDFASNGMPLEDYGASNNDMSFGPPRFEAAKFILEENNLNLEIKF